MAGVSLPVNVFCWLGWYEPSELVGPHGRLRRRGRNAAAGAARDPGAAERAQGDVPGEAAQGSDDAHRCQAAPARARGTATQVSRSSVVRLVVRRRAADGGGDVGAIQRQAVVGACELGWSAKPAR